MKKELKEIEAEEMPVYCCNQDCQYGLLQVLMIRHFNEYIQLDLICNKCGQRQLIDLDPVIKALIPSPINKLSKKTISNIKK